MLFRWMLHNWVRVSAKQKVLNAATQAIRKGFSDSQPQSSAEQTEMGPVEIVFVFATGVEAGGLVDKVNQATSMQCATFLEHRGLLHDKHCIVAEVGLGAGKVQAAISDIVALYRPKWVVSAGFATALDGQIRRGEIMMPSRLIATTGTTLETGLMISEEALEQTPGVFTGTLLGLDEPNVEANRKAELANQFDARAFDSESMVLANASQDSKTRFLAVRIITEGADDELSPAIRELAKKSTVAGKLGVAAGALFQNSAVGKEMWAMKAEAMKASEKLSKFLLSVIQQL